MTLDNNSLPPEAHETPSCDYPSWSFRHHTWSYRGEGNASLVVALEGEKKIVRLAKTESKLRRLDSVGLPISWLECKASVTVRSVEDTKERMEFSRKLMTCLLGSQLVQPGTVYHVPIEEIRAVEEILKKVRPEYRLHKRLAPICHVIMYPDCTALPYSTSSPYPVYCIELKPKQGYMDSKNLKCPFCLNQFLKKKHGKINVLSEYCPMDLFSGCPRRMVKAVLALLKTPQNNLRIFREGRLVFGEDECLDALTVLTQWFGLEKSSALDSFTYLLIKVLTANLKALATHPTRSSPPVQQSVPQEFVPFYSLLPTSSHRELTAPCCYHKKSLLPDHCVLKRLLAAQQLGDMDFGQLYEAYDKLMQNFSTDNNPDLLQPYQWTNPKLTAQWLASSDLEDDNNVSHPINQTAVQLIQRYRVLATARDCSLMITLQQLEKFASYEGMILEDHQGRPYAFHVSCIDLDPKPITCVEKHRRRNAAMKLAYAEAVGLPVP